MVSNNIKNDIAKIFLRFYLFSLVGWAYEILYETIIHRWKFMPREFLREPICPIYGIGGVILYLVFYKLIESKKINAFIKTIIIFVGTVLISSLLEYIASFVFEMFTGSWPWQGYSNYALNFNGRISLPTSIKFGVLGIVFLLLFDKPINKLFDILERKKLLNIIAIILLLFFVIDIIIGFVIPTNVRLNVVRECF